MVLSLIEQLKRRPDEVLLTESFMGIWNSATEVLVIHPGDFRNLGDEELEFFLWNKGVQTLKDAAEMVEDD